MEYCDNQKEIKSTILNLLNDTNIGTKKRHFKENGYKKWASG